MTSTMRAIARLSQAERDSWEAAGYIIVKEALSPDLADELHELALGHYHEDGSPAQPVYSTHRLWEREQPFRDVMNCPNTIGRVVDIIGEDIQLMSAEYIIRFRENTQALWHVDGADTSDGVGGFPPGILPGSLMQIKVGYALHDLLTPDCGVTRIVPGSHTIPNSRVGPYKLTGEDPAGAVPVFLAKGDAIIFHQSIWHTGGLVARDEPRVMLFYGYNYLFCRPFDYDQIPGEQLSECDPVQRRLLSPFAEGQTRQSRFYGLASENLRDLLGMESQS